MGMSSGIQDRTGVARRPRATLGDDAGTALTSLWLIGGLMLDAWAHSNRPGLESFFTPWHAVFYSGFAATAGWVGWVVWKHWRTGRRGLDAIPLGYGPTLIALAAFGLSGVADMFWHTLFGIEESIDILFSPSHLGLAITMCVIVTTPVRSAWTDPAPGTLRRLWPALLGIGLAIAEIMVFLEYGNALTIRATRIVSGFSDTENGSASQIAVRMLVTNAALLLPLLFVARRWGLPPGAATICTVPLLVLSGAETGGRNMSTLVSILVAAIGADLLAQALRPTHIRRWAYWAFATAVPFFTWSLYLGVAAAAVGRLPSIVELWTGAPIVAAAVGLLLGALMMPGDGGTDPSREQTTSA
ncbi:hypothetical protein [Nocardia goodfellowii]|uniref:Uncharacterized protein n=1 Tax=Nocardia goodfellowii TaxID=882446 RepID=A0ABS4QM59_9NOCA|nr:hypothetical protein [Nocardia goodfellowii]MBP2192796.1 hypothetical protein [Nocardia goodfellowii]